MYIYILYVYILNAGCVSKCLIKIMANNHENSTQQIYLLFTYQQTMDFVGYFQLLDQGNVVQNPQPDLLAVELTVCLQPECRKIQETRKYEL